MEGDRCGAGVGVGEEHLEPGGLDHVKYQVPDSYHYGTVPRIFSGRDSGNMKTR